MQTRVQEILPSCAKWSSLYWSRANIQDRLYFRISLHWLWNLPKEMVSLKFPYTTCFQCANNVQAHLVPSISLICQPISSPMSPTDTLPTVSSFIVCQHPVLDKFWDWLDPTVSERVLHWRFWVESWSQIWEDTKIHLIGLMLSSTSEVLSSRVCLRAEPFLV